MATAPNTRTRTAHALSIRAGGRAIGAIHSFSPSIRRRVDEVYEVQALANGLPVDIVPQIVEGREIRISRYDTYPTIMEEVFGSSELVVLTDQFRPFTIREVWRGPPQNFVGNAANAITNAVGTFNEEAARGVNREINQVIGLASAEINGNRFAQLAAKVAGSLTESIRVYEYVGCWFTDIGRSIDAKSDRVISVEATITHQDKKRVI